MNTTEDQKKPFSRNSSIEEKRIMSSSQESLDRRSEHEYPSRPSSRMSQIMENDNTPKIFSRPSSASDPRPESRNSSNTNQPLLSSSNSIKEDFNSRPSSAIDPRSESRNSLSSKPPLPRSTNPMIEDFKENSSNKAPFPTIKSDKMNSEESNRSSLQLKNLSKAKSPIPIEGDNDSGVDETTQGNDQSSNGDATSPRKSSAKPLKRISSATPSKSRSLSRDSKSPSLKSPDSTATTPGATEKKKLPMNRIQVGSAPSPNLKEVRSKIGSLQNTTYRPGGGNVKIENKKIDLKNVTPRIEAKNDKYMPKGGEKKILSQKLQWNAKSKIGSLENASHKPVSSGKKIETVKLDFKEKAKPKVGSKDNMKHVPGGGDIKNEEENEDLMRLVSKKIEHKKLDFQVQSKVGSLDNVKHKPKGGDKKIFDDKDYLRQMSAVSSENHSMSGSQNSLPSQPDASRDADENLNQHH
ncbi:hypothetical protein HHI36_012968 [Cryptolaemus montrouzieri]|uniref:Microtubule-associated protein n=1 Tax=Cryptolaemus montrouzieri TaxID=559131 RepID=A0ABD2NFZ3_9CUCU